MADLNRTELSDIATVLLPVTPFAEPARYVLAAGLNIVADDQGGVLLCLRPLLALRLNRQATALLSALIGRVIARASTLAMRRPSRRRPRTRGRTTGPHPVRPGVGGAGHLRLHR